MTLVNLTTLSADRRPVDTLIRTLVRSFQVAQRRRRIAMTIRTLERMDDRTLKDVGVRRNEIHDVARRIEDNPVN